MANKTISSLPTIPLRSDVLLTGVDLTRTAGDQNVKVLGSSFAGGAATTLEGITDAGQLVGAAGQFVGFGTGGVPAAFSKTTAQANLGIGKATLTFFLNGVANGTYTLIQRLPTACTLDSMDTSAQSGVFTVSSITLAGVAVSGLVVAVSAAANVNTLANGANAAAVGATVQLVITGTNQALGAVVSLNFTRN